MTARPTSPLAIIDRLKRKDLLGLYYARVSKTQDLRRKNVRELRKELRQAYREFLEGVIAKDIESNPFT